MPITVEGKSEMHYVVFDQDKNEVTRDFGLMPLTEAQQASAESRRTQEEAKKEAAFQNRYTDIHKDYQNDLDSYSTKAQGWVQALQNNPNIMDLKVLDDKIKEVYAWHDQQVKERRTEYKSMMISLHKQYGKEYYEGPAAPPPAGEPGATGPPPKIEAARTKKFF